MEKNKATGYLNSKKMPLKNHEDICIFYKKLPTYNPQMRLGYKPYVTSGGRNTESYGKQKQVINKSNGERYPLSVLDIKVERRNLHPTQKPVELFEYLIKTYSNNNDVVLDFTIGSGTTGVACVLNNRSFVGIELDSKFYKIAKNRIKEAEKIKKLMIFK